MRGRGEKGLREVCLWFERLSPSLSLSLVQCPCLYGSTESGGELREQLSASPCRPRCARDEQHLVQALALPPAQSWAPFPPPHQRSTPPPAPSIPQSEIATEKWTLILTQDSHFMPPSLFFSFPSPLFPSSPLLSLLHSLPLLSPLLSSLSPPPLPSPFLQGYSRVLVTTWGHDPTSVFASNLLLTVNDALTHSAVLIQVTLQQSPFPPHHSSHPPTLPHSHIPSLPPSHTPTLPHPILPHSHPPTLPPSHTPTLLPHTLPHSYLPPTLHQGHGWKNDGEIQHIPFPFDRDEEVPLPEGGCEGVRV